MLVHVYRLVPSTGRTKEFSVHSCKEAKEVLSSGPYLQSGVYWVQKQQVCSSDIEMVVYGMIFNILYIITDVL